MEVCNKCDKSVERLYSDLGDPKGVCITCYGSSKSLPEQAVTPLLHRAQDLICGDRQRDYGDKLQNFAQTAMIWTGIVAHKLQPGQSITPEDVCLLMMGLKMSRLAKTPSHEDSWMDIAGYVGCADMLRAEREKGVVLSGNTQDSGKLK